MKVSELISKLEALPPTMKIHVFTSFCEYGTPDVSLVSQKGRIKLATITAKEDE
jgi:hypothetical protein